MSTDEVLATLRDAMIEGDQELTRQETQKALDAGLDPLTVIENAGSKAMDVIGDRFQRGEAFLPELILASEAMQASLDLLLPHVEGDQGDRFQHGRVIMGTIVGDIHDIGKNITSALLSVHGFEVIDIGVDTAVERFLTSAQENGARFIGCSALLTTSMPYQRQLINYATDTGVRDQFYFAVGGGSVTPEWAQEIGADGWARSAAGAAELFRRIVSEGAPPPLPATILVDY